MWVRAVTTLKLTIEYDGTDFSGWQSQPNARTVQDVVERSIKQITGEQVRINGGGRTDAGVHAAGQVASLVLAKPVVPREFRRSLNGVLPADVIIRNAEETPEGFHARYSAVARQYRYTIHTGPSALLRRTAWSVGWELNTSYLQDCADVFAGSQNFRAFSKVGTEVKDWVCDVKVSAWKADGPILTYTIEANRFLYGMVRALVGTMVEVARGYRPVQDIGRILRSEDRSEAGMAAPPHGLCLIDILYRD